MKRILLILTLLILSNAQTQARDYDVEFFIGATDGSVSTSLDSETRAGLQLGANYRHFLNPQVAFSTGLHYVEKGGVLQYEIGESFFTHEDRLKTRFVQIPVQIKFYTPMRDSRLGFSAGFYYAMHLDTEFSTSNPDSIVAYPGYESNDYGLLAEVSFEMRTYYRNFLTFKLQFESGLAKHSPSAELKETTAGVFYIDDRRYQTVKFSVGHTF